MKWKMPVFWFPRVVHKVIETKEGEMKVQCQKRGDGGRKRDRDRDRIWIKREWDLTNSSLGGQTSNWSCFN